jgi:probable HAF family extracellular repeat protein
MTTDNTRRYRVLPVAIAAMLAAATAPAAPRFELLEPPAQGAWADFSLSRDGSQMGCVLDGAVYWWSEDAGFRFLDPGVAAGGGVGMAADGSVLVAARAGSGGAMPTMWHSDGRRSVLGSLVQGCNRDLPTIGGYDVSNGGRIAVGQAATCSDEVAFRWSSAGGMRGLPTPADGDSRGAAVSADGTVIAGFCEDPRQGFRRPAVWRDGGEPEFILGPRRRGEAMGISPDGARIVGQADLGGPAPRAFIWTAAEGIVNLGSLEGRTADASVARAVSDDGRVVGWSGDAWGEQEAFLWTAATGMRPLAAILGDAGVRLPEGMILTAALDISGDGRTIVGIARDREWAQHYWRIHLDAAVDAESAARRPEPLAADPARPDSLDAQAADMFDLYPFTRRRY